jgi:hypothetical protein
MRILFAGIIARYPFGGVAWCSLMYLLGLRALGHEVFYIEDTGECVYDPVQNAIAIDPSYGTAYIRDALEPFGLGDRWSFVNYDGSYHGRSAEDVRRYCSGADLFVNLSGGVWFWRDEYARIPCKIFIDSDPAFTQLAIAKAVPWYVEFFGRFDRLFTFGSNIGTPASPVPTGQLAWFKTWQPVTLADWRATTPPGASFSTVMTWQMESFTDVGGNKETAARTRLEHGRRHACFPHAPGISRFHPPLQSGVRRGQTYLRSHALGLVQRSHRVLSGVRPSGFGPGHRLDRTPSERRGVAGVLDAGRSSGGNRSD